MYSIGAWSSPKQRLKPGVTWSPCSRRRAPGRILLGVNLFSSADSVGIGESAVSLQVEIITVCSG